MPMTHYMELLAVNQPWNLLLFMAVPVILAETVAITELFILYARPVGGRLVTVNRAASIAGGLYFAGVFVYLFVTAVIPISSRGEWRGPADVIAVGAYLSGVIPLLGMALLDMRLVGANLDADTRLKVHATLVAIFLVVAHVAMIFGMLDPTLLQTGSEAAGHSGRMPH
jgi:hypothetical protein